MATKDNKRQVRELVEALEQRVHAGPAVGRAEIQSARDFLQRNDFSPASDYFHRLTHLESRLHGRTPATHGARGKRNYGGKAAGYQMQVQSIYDHVILSICYAGDFNLRHGRVKISHRFNQEGRIDFVELKYLNSLHPPLNGELRKLLTIEDYPSLRKDWLEAEAHVLKVLPQELVFLYEDIFRCPRAQIFAWLLNIGHGIVADLLQDLKSRQPNGQPLPVPTLAAPAFSEPSLGWSNDPRNRTGTGSAHRNGNGRTVCLAQETNGSGLATHRANGINGNALRSASYPEQLPLDILVRDDVALPILEKAASLESVVEMLSHTAVVVRYTRKSPF
ncbi:MAG TPA: hypothetical protein VMB80_12810 [Candidatus Acidoferrum sp.]|nr:hypothetical protein [Candidatus Acidoferrum sp.]